MRMLGSLLSEVITLQSIDSTANEIYNLIKCSLDKLDVGDKFSGWNPRFRINVVDGYNNVLGVSGDISAPSQRLN